MFTPNAPTRIAAIALSVLTATDALALPTSDFKRVLAHPESSHGTRVTLVGIADVHGYGFFLYERTLKNGKPDLSRSVFVVDHPKRPLPDKLNKHWLKVIGTVNAHAHGPQGTEPCEIVLDRFEELPIPPLKEQRIFGVFRNETASTVIFKLSGPEGYSTSALAPSANTIDALDDKKDAIATTSNQTLVAKRNILPLPGPKYFDSVNRKYYFRITNGKIKPVLPAQGKKWLKGAN
jgi:hypothetical protein